MFVTKTVRTGSRGGIKSCTDANGSTTNVDAATADDAAAANANADARAANHRAEGERRQETAVRCAADGHWAGKSGKSTGEEPGLSSK